MSASSQAMATYGPRTGAAVAAMEGRSIDLDLSQVMNRSAVIRGIRESPSFASGSDITNLCTGPQALENSDFARARNARLIMSDIMPSAEELGLSNENEKMPGPSADQYPRTKIPYCIWHPDFAKEDIYRKLAIRYQALKYQVARACAAAGYDVLYSELDVLPDISVAEEARESQVEGSQTIYDSVMSQPFRYAIMNDYSLSINVSSPECPAFLNGDAVVKWMTNHYPYWQAQVTPRPVHGSNDPLPCITEDNNIKLYPHVEHKLLPLLTDVEVRLQVNPLPRDLPTVKKTLLIQMAAYNGDIDRYTRLVRRPLWLGRIEHLCLVRGIYHHSQFALFWADQIKRKTNIVNRMNSEQLIEIKKAVAARRIIDGDRQVYENGWDPETPQPLLIWWPEKPSTVTLWDMFAKAPTMRETVIVAGIMCDYDDVYFGLEFPPTRSIYLAAKTSSNPIYKEKVLQAAEEQGIEFRQDDPLKWSERIVITQVPRHPSRWPDVPKQHHDTMELHFGGNMDVTDRLDPWITYMYFWDRLNNKQ